MNIINRYNLKTKKINIKNLKIFIVFIFYFLSIVITPINTAKNYKQHQANNFINNNNKYPIIIINTATYIFNSAQLIQRQIDSNNLQSYINGVKGSVLKLNDFENGTNNKTYSYDAYGNVISGASKFNSKSSSVKLKSNPILDDTNNLLPNSFQYNSERFDNNSKLQYLRARFYNPETKRFINQDNYDLPNKFGYVNTNPVIYSDPAGHDANLSMMVGIIFAGIVGIALIFGAGFYAYIMNKEDNQVKQKTSRDISIPPPKKVTSQNVSFPPFKQFTQKDGVSCGQFAMKNFLIARNISEKNYNDLNIKQIGHRTDWDNLKQHYINLAPQNILTVLSDGNVAYYPKSYILSDESSYKRSQRFAEISKALEGAKKSQEEAQILPETEECINLKISAAQTCSQWQQVFNTVFQSRQLISTDQVLKKENITNMLLRDAAGGHWIHTVFNPENGKLTVNDSLNDAPYETEINFLTGKTIYY